MKRYILPLALIFCCMAVAELPIPQTKFRKAPLETLQQYANDNNSEAQLELALRYYAGHQVEASAEQAVQWMARSAKQENAQALFLLSRMAAEGIGMDRNREQEELFFARAISAAPENEEFQLLYEQYSRDKDRSAGFLKKCADAGYVPAYIDQYLPVAVAYYEKGDYEQALPIFLDLVDNGSSSGAFYLAEMYAKGIGGLPFDDVEAFVWYQKAAQDGNANAQYELGIFYEQGRGTLKNLQQAERLFARAAESGHMGAQYKMAEMEFEKAVAAESRAQDENTEVSARNEYQRHLRQAVKWYQVAADKNYPPALYVMGRLFASGEGVPRNYKEAMRCYQSAADLGQPDSFFYLGLMYHAGLGVTQNIPKALQYYKDAADKGVTGAWFYLGNSYRLGVGVEKQPMRGEGVYYGKILRDVKKNLDGDSSGKVRPDEWFFAAAREYGIILWQRASTRDQFVDATGWMGLAAQNGDQLAQEIILKMNERTRQSYRSGKLEGLSQIELAENQADPARDAVLLKRSPNFFPYAQSDVDELYARTDVRENIVFAEVRDSYFKSVEGDELLGLSVKYRRPSTRSAIGFSGILLMGIEFVDNKTDEKYWSFCEYRDENTAYSGQCYIEASMLMDMGAYSDVRVSDWAVVYGHLLKDGSVVAIFDHREKTQKTGDLTTLFQRNRYSTVIENETFAIVDIARSAGQSTLDENIYHSEDGGVQ